MPRSVPLPSAPVSPNRRRIPLRRFRCVSCSYGAARRVEPTRCPLCGGREWVDETATPDAISIFPGVPFS